MVGSFEYQQMVYHLADGIQRSNRGIQLTLSPERRNNPYYGQLVIDENGELAIEQYIFQGDKIIIDGVDRTNDLRYPIPVSYTHLAARCESSKRPEMRFINQ